MKPFDLEAAKRGEPIVTRDGRAVSFVAYLPTLKKACHRVIVTDGDTIQCCDERGNAIDYGPHDWDLFMAPRKRTVWVNVYIKEDGSIYTHGHESEALAKRFGVDIDGSYRGFYPLEIEE